MLISLNLSAEVRAGALAYEERLVHAEGLNTAYGEIVEEMEPGTIQRYLVGTQETVIINWNK